MPSPLSPQLSLAFGVASSPGVYALVIGSGVSRSAQIPTGWEIVLDLVRKLAAAEGDDPEPDPARWYSSKYGEAPQYSALLEQLGPKGAERQSLLRPYFEATEEEKAEGMKTPTEAHRALADLVASGLVRVIVTTNFDRLLETALESAGVTPAVIATADQVAGALPLAHSGCTVVKVHGDYLDARIRNSDRELAEYEPRGRPTARSDLRRIRLDRLRVVRRLRCCATGGDGALPIKALHHVLVCARRHWSYGPKSSLPPIGPGHHDR